jgi:hypothetical protein
MAAPPMRIQKALPYRLPLTFWSRLNSVILKNISDGRIGYFVSQIYQCSLYSIIAPVGIIFDHLNQKLNHLFLNAIKKLLVGAPPPP